jgi:hypothetical protein
MILVLLTSIPDPSKWVTVIKAVTDPYSLLALIVLVLASLGYQATRDKTTWARMIGLLIIASALVALGLNTLRVANTETTGKAEPKSVNQFQGTIVFRGSRNVLEPMRVPFQVGSGQVNFGCRESAHPSVSTNLPAGARGVNATAQWVNTSNVKGQDQQAIVTGSTVTASGTVTGLDRDWIGNCPGGGHGELILKGSYVIDQPKSPEPITKSVTAVFQAGVPLTFDLPTETDQSTDSCEITISTDKGQYAHGVWSILRKGGQTNAEVLSKEGPISMQAGKEQIVLTVN